MIEYTIGKNATCFELEKEEIVRDWEKYKPFLEKSVPYSSGYITLDTYKGMVTEENTPYKVWVVFLQNEASTVFVSRFSDVGFLKVMDYEILGGSRFDSWVDDLIFNFESMIAKQFNIQQFRIIGRAGWHKKLKKFGYKSSHVVAIRNV